MRDELIVGGLYSVESGGGRFSVVKVLALDPGVVHARLYREKFESRPATVDTSSLSLGTVFTDTIVGIGHTPLALEGFMRWRPILLMITEMTDDELEGYRFWKGSIGIEPPKGIMQRIFRLLRRNRSN